MRHLLYKRQTAIPLVFFVLSLIFLSNQSVYAKADSPLTYITNSQVVNSNGQLTLFFVRGSDIVGFNITIANNASSTVEGIIVITIQDVNGIVIQTLTLPNFSVNPGTASNITVFSDRIPSWAYVGIASAQVNFLNSKTYIALCPSATTKFYIGIVSNPSNPFAALAFALTNASITAGDSVYCNATAFDAAGNSIDVTYFASWTASYGARGGWIGSIYVSSKAGVWNITTSIANLITTAELTVKHASPVSIALSPQNATVTAGESPVFTSLAFDAYSNTWDVTNSTVFTLNPAAGGSWSGNAYHSAKAGVWNVSGIFSSITNATILRVNHEAAINLTISPKNVTLNSGLSRIYKSMACDFYGNTWDTTNLTAFTVDTAAGGFWAANNYTSSKVGNWIVTASYNGLKDLSSLAVFHTIDLNLDGRVNFRDIQSFVTVYVNSRGGIVDDACDLNHDRTLNFNDIKLFVAYYIQYWSL